MSTILTKSRLDDNLTNAAPLFAPMELGSYIYPERLLSPAVWGGNIDIPLVIDTEFQGQSASWQSKPQSSREHLTTQIVGVGHSEGLILVNPDYAQLTPWQPVTSIFHPIDYLTHNGHTVSLERVEDKRRFKGLPKCRFVLYAHFALAEFLMVVSGELKDDLKKIVLNRKSTGNKIELKRHLELYRGANKGGYQSKQPYIELPWIITIDGVEYAFLMTYHDTVALHGQASYKDLCANTGIELKHKDKFSSDEKSQMKQMMLTKTEDFEDYAMGDLEVYKILVNNADKFKDIHDVLGVGALYKEPAKTIGATVKNLFSAVLTTKLGLDPRDFNKQVLTPLMAPMSAGSLRENPKETSALLAKVDGGRCRNNRPTDTFVKGPIVDLDISGCYGEGQRVQLFPIGKPEIITFGVDSEVNDYWNLEEFLKVYQSELVPGLWMARVSFEGKLKYAQDFFASWFLANGHGENLLAKYVQTEPTDTDDAETENLFNEEDGNQKILQHQILNAVLTHDSLQWILKVSSTRQRKELLEGLKIKSAAIYPKSKQLNSWDDLEKAIQNHTGQNQFKRVGRGSKAKTIRINGECHNWIAFNIGELIIDDLLFNRKQFPKKTPMNTLFKLCVNTLYGDMTSKYFQSANVVVGNNITARARALAWYMEKGLNGFQTITDGCAFELNRVVYPKEDRGFHAGYLVDTYDKLTDGNLSFKPLDNADNIELTWDNLGTWDADNQTIKYKDLPTIKVIKNGKVETYAPTKDPKHDGCYFPGEAFKWIDNAAMKHLQNLFDVDVLHAQSTSLKPQEIKGQWQKTYTDRKGQFEFEAKDFYDLGIFHGTSNYTLINPNAPEPSAKNIKMRSYETKKAHVSVELQDGTLSPNNRYSKDNNPAIDLMRNLKENIQKIERQTPFIKTGIVKIADWVQRHPTYKALDLEPGDTFNKSGMLRELSLSQFTFKTFEQWKAWDRVYTRLKDKYGQSFEMFFIDNDGYLHYQKMIKTVQNYIATQDINADSSELNPILLFDKNYNAGRDLEQNHPNWTARIALAEMLKGE